MATCLGCGEQMYKQDRQNFMSCVRRAGYEVRRALIQMQSIGVMNMSGPEPRQIKRSLLPNQNDDNNIYFNY